jgi:carboxylesterase
MKLNSQVFLEGTNGKAVMLMHGITAGASQMLPMAHFLNDYGYSVFCANLAGHGTYPEDMFHTGCAELIQKAEYDYSLLKAEFGTVYAGGLSTGGCLSLYLAAMHPELAGIIPVSSPLSLVPGTFLSENYPPSQRYFHRSMDGKTGLYKKYHIHYTEIPVCIFRALYDLMDILNDDGVLEQIKCPAFIVQAENDEIAEPWSAQKIFDRISSENKSMYRPKTGGHSIVLADERLEVFRRSVEFLDSL